MSLGFRFQLVSGNPTTPLERGEAYYDADSDRYQVRPGSVARGQRAACPPSTASTCASTSAGSSTAGG